MGGKNSLTKSADIIPFFAQKRPFARKIRRASFPFRIPGSFGIMVVVLGSPKGMRHILPAETRATVRMPIKATVPFSNPPEQQCYLNDNHTLPPGWCIPVSSLPVRRKAKGQGNGREKQKTYFYGSRPGDSRKPHKALRSTHGSPPGI